MTGKSKKGSDAMRAAVQRRAMEIVQLPPEKREARYALYRRAFAESVMEGGVPRENAEQYATQVDEWIRTMVKVIETGGGASGGRA